MLEIGTRVYVADAQFARVEDATENTCYLRMEDSGKPLECHWEDVRPAPEFYRWTVEFGVSANWVADGFNLDDQRALSMLAHDLGWANMSTELSARVLTAPAEGAIRMEQGYPVRPDDKLDAPAHPIAAYDALIEACEQAEYWLQEHEADPTDYVAPTEMLRVLRAALSAVGK